MIDWLSGWAQAIIIAVIIATIIEMILPEGSSKKYIKVVVGVYIVFTIISPMITKLTGKSLAVSDVLDLNKYIDEVKEKETSQNLLQEENSANIRDIYIANLKADIQNKLKGKGYIVTDIVLDVGYDDNYTLNIIELKMKKQDETEGEEEKEANSESNTMIEVINEIKIGISNTVAQTNNGKEENINKSLSNSEKKKIKAYLSSVYEINEKNIVIH